jgi:hypothetical protein
MAQYDVIVNQNVESGGIQFIERVLSAGKGRILTFDSGNIPVTLAAGTDGYILSRDDSESTGLKWIPSASGIAAFKTWHPASDSGYIWGSSDVVASGTDTMDIIPGTGIAIDTDATSKAIRIRTTGSGGITSAYSSMTDGSVTANASGSDTFKFRSASNKLTLAVTSNDATHGDNVLFTINEGNLSIWWSQITSKPTTLSGYGITDAYTKTEADGLYVNLTGNETVAGVKTWSDNAIFSGNVGIGTTTPSQKLEISDTDDVMLRINSTKNDTWVDGDVLGGIEWYGNDLSGAGADVKSFIKTTAEDTFGSRFTMKFGTNVGSVGDVAETRMVIKSNGNVGIGTTTPSTKLDVDGKIKTSTLQVTTTPTAGYVLTSDASGNASWAAIIAQQHTIASHSATAWRMFYSNATTTAVQELAFGASGKVLMSNGPLSAPTWETVYSNIGDNIIFDGSADRYITMSSSTTVYTLSVIGQTNLNLGSAATGGDVEVYAGTGPSTNADGQTGGAGGDLILKAGKGGASATSGSTGGNGGTTIIRGGENGWTFASGDYGDGGDVKIIGGSAPGGIGGDVFIYGGIGTELAAGASNGNVYIGSGSTSADYGRVFFQSGSVSNPAISFRVDPNTGIYWKSTDNIAISCGGSEVISVASSGVTVTDLIITGNLTVPKIMGAAYNSNVVNAPTTGYQLNNDTNEVVTNFTASSNTTIKLPNSPEIGKTFVIGNPGSTYSIGIFANIGYSFRVYYGGTYVTVTSIVPITVNPGRSIKLIYIDDNRYIAFWDS